MKKLILIMTMLTLMCGSAFADIGADVEKGMKKFFEDNNIALDVKIDVLKKLEEPKGIYFVKMTLNEPSTGRQQEQFVFTDGKYLMPDVMTIDTNTSLKDMLSFEMSEKVDLDVSRMTLMYGNKNAKHTIITVSDFQCPYCKKAHSYLTQRIDELGVDVAVYMMHLPLSFHKKAKLYAAVFEAGKMMGKNFSDELYATTQADDEAKDEDIINKFAKMSGDAEKFKTFVKSPSIAGKIAEHMKLAESMGITGTPHMFFDGRSVGGFKQSMIELGLKSMK